MLGTTYKDQDLVSTNIYHPQAVHSGTHMPIGQTSKSKYLLVIVDTFSKWAEAFETKEDTKTVARKSSQVGDAW